MTRTYVFKYILRYIPFCTYCLSFIVPMISCFFFASLEKRKWCKDNTFLFYTPNFLGTFFKKIFLRSQSEALPVCVCKGRTKIIYKTNILRVFFICLSTKLSTMMLITLLGSLISLCYKQILMKGYQQLSITTHTRTRTYNI